ncbi:MAG TPA: beta-propeller fold lactonase family protein [Stellaceae bacterium]
MTRCPVPELGTMLGALVSVLLLTTTPASADIAVSANDAHTVLQDGNQVAAKDPPPDSMTIIDLGHYPPKLGPRIDAPASVVGPPSAVAVTRDERYALVASSTKLDPQDAGKIVPDDRLSLIDLKSSPPKIVQQVTAGAGAAGVAISPDGGLVLVANRTEGTVSVFTMKDGHLDAAGKLDLGNAKAGPSGVAFTRDGKSALLSRDGDSMISVLHVDGTRIEIDPRPVTTGVRPYTLDVTRDGRIAAVSNMGRGDGDTDTVSLIDLSVSPFRTVETVSVGSSPEGLKFSPDGKILAIGIQNGTTKAHSSPFYANQGRLLLFAVEGKHLRKLAEAPIGQWSQGIAFAKDGRTILVENMVERTIAVFRWERDKLSAGKPLTIGAGPAAIRTAWP